MKDAEDAESSRALACAVKPLGVTTNTLQVISKTLESARAMCVMTVGRAESEGGGEFV